MSVAQFNLPILPAPIAATGEAKTATSRAHESARVRDGGEKGILRIEEISENLKQWVADNIYTFNDSLESQMKSRIVVSLGSEAGQAGSQTVK